MEAKYIYIICYVTCRKLEEAQKIASTLVEEKIAAGVNIVNEIQSIYRWKGKVCDNKEHLLIITTKKENFAKLEEKVKQLHSYEVPEIIALPIIDGSFEYLDWIKTSTK